MLMFRFSVKDTLSSKLAICSTENSSKLPSPEALFSSKCITSRLVGGLRPDPLAEFSVLPETLSWIMRCPLWEGEGWYRGGMGRGSVEGGKGWRRKMVGREKMGREGWE